MNKIDWSNLPRGTHSLEKEINIASCHKTMYFHSQNRAIKEKCRNPEANRPHHSGGEVSVNSPLTEL